MNKRPFLLLPLAMALAAAAVACGGGEDNPFQLESQTVAQAGHAAALAFAPDGRLFFAEQFSGDIRVVGADGKAQDEPWAHVDVANWLNQDWGLTGLAIDPDFAGNGYVYAFYTEPAPSPADDPIARPKIVRFTDEGGRGTSPQVIVDDFPTTRKAHQGFNANGSLHFGPDDALYAMMGDYDFGKDAGPNGRPPAQDPSLPLGKMLRLDSAGAALPDNPFAGQEGADPRVFAWGFNHATNFTFHPQTGAIYQSDNTGGCEEINIIKPGGDYGWPDVGDFPFPDCNFGEQVKAIHLLAKPGMKPGGFLSFVDVAGLEFVSASAYPTLGDGLLLCEAVTKQMRRLTLSGEALDQVTADDVVIKDCSGDVTAGPDGAIYYSSETDIRKLVAKKP
ncbi:MAG: PQQ-dependent sugar dehydrogenase [Dehalococcoidia bacterium]|nr:PQQ-dependent sugar dehydrogenase [Dehalococcoidia bacterium]